MASFPISLAILGHLSTPESSTAVYVLAELANGLCTGAALNYTLAHLLHLTLPSTHFIATSLLAAFRGFAGSFGSAVGGGVFARLLRAALEKGFADRGLDGKEELVRQLLGSPALAARLVGPEREVAVEGYVSAIQGLFMAGVGLSVVVIFIQAGTGWSAPVVEDEIILDGERDTTGLA
jgi:hypothetical protein